jgi:hypothetical protein
VRTWGLNPVFGTLTRQQVTPQATRLKVTQTHTVFIEH